MIHGFFKKNFRPVTPPTLVVASLIATYLMQISETQAQAVPPSASAPAIEASTASTTAPMPADIFPSSPLAQVIRLTQAGVNENIIQTYISNSTSTFNLDADKIVYLDDVGVPNELISAMMQRDQELQQSMIPTTTPPTETTPPPAPAPTDTSDNIPPAEPQQVTINYFDTALAPYGGWVVVPGYGRCWRPTTIIYNSNWQPYCDRGHWVYTDCGWYWDSDYAWGVTFHYGRWFRAANFGWCWWPDITWAPSWVTWRYSDNYCGWAPLPPFAVYKPGVGFTYQGNGVSVGFNFGLASDCFTFVPTANFCDRYVRSHRIAPGQVTQIFNQTTVINNISFNNRKIINNGIAVQHISDALRRPIRQTSVDELKTSALQNLRDEFSRKQDERPNANQNPSAFQPQPNANGQSRAPATRGLQNDGAATERHFQMQSAHDFEARQNGQNANQNQTITPAENHFQPAQSHDFTQPHPDSPANGSHSDRPEIKQAIQNHVEQQQQRQSQSSGGSSASGRSGGAGKNPNSP